MKTAILIHGMPSKEEYFNPESQSLSNKHWFPWIQRQLLLNNILAQTPEMPEPYRPNYEKWKVIFEQFKVDEDTILIGHSCGGGFLVRWLSENKIKVGKVILVAPWINPEDPRAEPDFFKFEIDKDFPSRTSGVTIFISLDDDKAELDTVDYLKENLNNLEIKEFTDKGHFTMGDMGTEEFKELADVLIN